jgi:F1F0 ATPase subunit 2
MLLQRPDICDPAPVLERPQEFGMLGVSLWHPGVLFIAGLILGSLYFGGLWLTLNRLPRWRHPFLALGLSLLVRLTILLGGGAWLLQSSAISPLQTILLLSAGVWLSRMVLIVRLLATMPPKPARSAVHS